MGKVKSIESFFGITSEMNRRERGQILVLVAMMMVGLLAAAGLAVDGGFLMLRKAQLDRAVDAAALAGAPVAVPGSLQAANVRGLQMLAANGFVIQNPTLPQVPSGTAVLDFTQCTNGSLPQEGSPISGAPMVSSGTVAAPINFYCGLTSTGNMAGSVRYHALVRYNVPLFFMPIIGINNVPLSASATGEYYSMVDMYASDTAQYGLLETAGLAIFGPDICTDYGDPFTPTSSAWYNNVQPKGAYTFRIAIPENYPYKTVRVELFDPDSYNTTVTAPFPVWSTTGSTTSQSRPCNDGSTDRKDTCLAQRDPVDPYNDFWFVRVDENRGTGGIGCGEPPGDSSSYTINYETRVLYRLYYKKRTAAGTHQEVDLAYYYNPLSNDSARPGEAASTDLMWVSPGAPAAEGNTVYNNIKTGLNSVAEPLTRVENCETWRVADTVVVGSSASVTADVSPAAACSTPNENDDTDPTTYRRGNFIVNLEALGPSLAALGTAQETPDIYADPNTKIRYLYLDVRGLRGASETGFQLWAGPSNLEEPNTRAPAQVNARHIYIQTQRALSPPVDWHLSRGIQVLGMGRLPMNNNTNARVEIPLSYLDTTFAGQPVNVRLFDPDSGSTSPVLFYFDTISKFDWTACFASGTVSGRNPQQQCDWLSGRPAGTTPIAGPAPLVASVWNTYAFTAPSDRALTNPQPFYGGRLTVSYQGGANDTLGWWITAPGRPVLVQ